MTQSRLDFPKRPSIGHFGKSSMKHMDIRHSLTFWHQMWCLCFKCFKRKYSLNGIVAERRLFDISTSGTYIANACAFEGLSSFK
jgi:hypothetical protein